MVICSKSPSSSYCRLTPSPTLALHLPSPILPILSSPLDSQMNRSKFGLHRSWTNWEIPWWSKETKASLLRRLHSARERAVSIGRKVELAVANMDSRLHVYDIVKAYDSCVVNPSKVKAWKIAFHPSGKELLAASTSLWAVNPEDGKVTREFGAGSRFITSLKCSPNGKLIAAGNVDGGITFYTTDNYTCAFNAEDHALTVRDVGFIPDGTAMLSVSDDMHIDATDL
eukprot:TRINITY_DN11753_c0_g1_i5.p1 TRINITY_DN11753_c0_g1~~TRINITY_DN11753_c0_g1_i5.p1  ORF type:complete len:248 (+),score=8.62 TRINITY_DN11753_c0_g1_i5:65-745(+)